MKLREIIENTTPVPGKWITHMDLSNMIQMKTGSQNLASMFYDLSNEDPDPYGNDVDFENYRDRVNKILRDNKSGIQVLKVKQDEQYNTLYQILQSARLDADLTFETAELVEPTDAEIGQFALDNKMPVDTEEKMEWVKAIMMQQNAKNSVPLQDRARKIIATYRRQRRFKSPVEPDITKISGTPEQYLHTEIKSQLFKSYTRDPAFGAYLKDRQTLYLANLKKKDPQKAQHYAIALNSMEWPPGKMGSEKRGLISKFAKDDATKYLTMYLQDTNLDHPVIA